MKKINLNGIIGDEVMSKDITVQLDSAKGDSIEVFLHSPGGSVMEGLAIFNAFRSYKRTYPFSRMTLSIKGVAASMASYIASNTAFDHVSAEDNAVFMLHHPHGATVGNHTDMKKMEEILFGLSRVLAEGYAARIKKSVNDILKMMDAETWFFGAEMKDAGFVDEIIKTGTSADKATAIATAKYNFKAMTGKMSGKEESIEKIAALIKPEVSPVIDPGVRAFYDDLNRHRAHLGMQPLSENEWPEVVKAREEIGLSPQYVQDGIITTEADMRHRIKKLRRMTGQEVQ